MASIAIINELIIGTYGLSVYNTPAKTDVTAFI